MKILKKILFRRRSQRIQNPRLATGKKRLAQLCAILFLVIILHTISLVLFEQDLHWWDAFWLSWTTVTTVGYGDFSATTPWGRITTMLLMYCLGISLLAQLASEYIEYRIDRRERKIKGHWEWKNMQDHILIINTPKHAPERYLTRLVAQVKMTPTLCEHPIQILTRRYANGLPKSLIDHNVVHFHGQSETIDALLAVNVARAKYIILVARDEDDSVSDCLTFDVLDRIREIGATAALIVEAVEDQNRARFYRLGAQSVIRPIRAYPELVVRAMASPGTEQILENLFSHRGDYPHRFEVQINCQNWKDLACKIMMRDMGTAMGYITHQNEVRTNPSPSEPVKGKALLVVVHQNHVPSQEALQDCINQ